MQHQRTLAAASNLAADLHDLGEIGEARQLNADTLSRMRPVLGEDHRHTLRTADRMQGPVLGS
jgi:hypothetical protein